MSGRLWDPTKKLDIMLTVYKAIPGGHGGATCRLNGAANDDEFLENVDQTLDLWWRATTALASCGEGKTHSPGYL